MRPRVLWCSECSVLNTGYSVYSREILKRLYSSGLFDIAEFGIYIAGNDPRLPQIPWKVYPNLPNPGNQEEMNRYNSLPSNQFGEWKFEEVCLDFMPHVVCDIRDWWMIEFQERSPFRRLFDWLIMPTVDSSPQNEQWISTFASADGVFTYQDWSLEILKKEGAGKINLLGAAPPSAEEDFKPIPEIKEIKKNLGLDEFRIIGTIMRNQRRKLYPDLFEAFRRYLNETGDNKTLLYCHASYPDMGWDFPRMLLDYGLSSKVLFTYVCENCKYVYPSFFSNSLSPCIKCHAQSAGLANVRNGVPNNILAIIINLFDIYIQYANSEGFGMPQVEAAACGVPIMSIDFSAMTDVVRKLKGIPIPYLTTYIELETGCRRAIPDNIAFVRLLKNVMQMPEESFNLWKHQTRQAFEQNYDWNKTAEKWASYILGVNFNECEKKWHSQPRIHNPATGIPNGLSHEQYAKFLLANVLGEPERINTYMETRLIRDLNNGVTSPGPAGMYFNEQSALFSRPNWQQFDRETAYKHFVGLCERRNFWENKRIERLRNRR